ncbi:ribosomal-protein-serine acetyltransferase [Janthinobacterium sp. CG_23.3]|uniref:GNAT family N-acetyltransferase n=1 Tax=Janthinobacterium sp. CG_23.3 TaxID=3349634 RepID=UPI0038D48428
MKASILEVAPSLRAVPVAVADAAALAALVQKNHAYLLCYLPAVTALASPADAEAYLRHADALAESGDVLEWHIFSHGELCGAVRLNHIETEHHKVSIGYYIGADYQGNGIATLAVRAILAYGFQALDVNRVELRCVAANAPSIRLAERLGFVREGVLRQAELLDGAFCDLWVYGLLRDDFVWPVAAPDLGGIAA